MDGLRRVVIENVAPEIDGGRFPIKRVIGEAVTVEADIFTHGHTQLSCTLLYRRQDEAAWQTAPMQPLGNDRWQGCFSAAAMGGYVYTLRAVEDHFQTWRVDLAKRIAARQDLSTDMLIGAALVSDAARRAQGEDRKKLLALAARLEEERATELGRELAQSAELAQLMARHLDQTAATTYERELRVVVDREKARFSSWYEMFPRSAAEKQGHSGAFADCEARLPYVAGMGFDVLYLPPIHPIGRSHRKGRNNAPEASKGDPGSPWAIGSEEGGHTAIEPSLGTLEDFRHLLQKAEEHGIEVALDIAFQCSPDHPWVREHPEWFKRRPDGSIQYAENPPKKYEDIYPLEFETEDWQALWQALKEVFLFWIRQGVRIFRVDNPHTKPFAFWEWLIGDVKERRPEVIFLSEAFTRPRIMYRLAKLGFTQSYSYFPWRNTKRELTDYFMSLTQTEVKEYFRPNLWPNTPDILTEYLQTGGRPGFISRLVLAATLGASYGIYGPAFELCEDSAREPGSEEYLDSEKYEARHWEIDSPDSLSEFIGVVNRIRRDNAALQSNDSLAFHHIDNEELICYSKRSADGENTLLMVVNLDPHHRHSGWAHLDLEVLGLPPEASYQVHDLLTGSRFLWHGAANYVELDPHVAPAHIFRVRRHVRSEHDFEYFL